LELSNVPKPLLSFYEKIKREVFMEKFSDLPKEQFLRLTIDQILATDLHSVAQTKCKLKNPVLCSFSLFIADYKAGKRRTSPILCGP
jgi:hypothetical protein